MKSMKRRGSISVRSNPTNYNLKEGSFTVKDIDRIYDTLRRRARAAFTYRWNIMPDPKAAGGIVAQKIKKEAEAIEYGLTASWETARKWADTKTEIVRFATDVKHERWMRAQKIINDSKVIIRGYEGDCFAKVRNARHIKSLSAGRAEESWLNQVRAYLTRLSMAYPYVSRKNRPRLVKVLRKHLAKHEWKDRAKAGNIYPSDLVAAGIPAAEIVGPWWQRTKDIKSPMDWIKDNEQSVSSMISDNGPWHMSPRATDWVRAIDLDYGDRQLVQAVEHYYDRNKTAPSVDWVRRRSNELEEERTNKDLETQVPRVEEWLEESEYWRRSADFAEIYLPIMPDPTFRVLRQGDGDLLCRTARRDGLCVVDAVINILDNAGMYADEERTSKAVFRKSKEEGFVTLIISTDPKRRTVVGLNELGICTSEHHCTGISNKVDKVAYEYFKKPKFED